MSAPGRYLLDNRSPGVGDRLAALADLFDDWTFRHLQAVGLAAGWHCWEVGPGGATVPAWLSAQVGPAGRVVATDLDVSHLDGTHAAAPAGVDIRVHDVGVDPAPDGGFDLVHARLVLTHVPHRDGALARMAAALKPGGWLVVEDADPGLQPLLCLDEAGPDEELANRLRRGFRSLLAGRGAELAYGRRLPRLLRSVGLTEVHADAFFPITAPACAVLERATVELVRAELVAAGLATDAEVDRHLANVASGRLDLATSPLVSAWGRRAA